MVHVLQIYLDGIDPVVDPRVEEIGDLNIYRHVDDEILSTLDRLYHYTTRELAIAS
jgi:hypothetical protein